MNTGRHPVIGVLGGMGPLATVELLRRVVEATPAQDDSDHVHMIVDNNPNVPSRIAALIDGDGTSPQGELAKMACRLRDSGCDLLAMPCNTAHLYVDVVRRASGLEVLDMVALTMEHLTQMDSRPRRIGILASKAVQQSGLFANAFQSAGMEAIFPAETQAEVLMELIKGVKRNAPRQEMRRRLADSLEGFRSDCRRKVDILLLACSELSILYTLGYESEGVVDSLSVLANEVVRRGRKIEQFSRDVG